MEETKELYMDLLEHELNRGPFVEIVQIARKILLKLSKKELEHKIPIPVQNAAVVCLGICL